MPQITITLDLPAEALRDLFNSYGNPTVKARGAAIRAEATARESAGPYRPGAGRGEAPVLPSVVEAYRRLPGDLQGAIRGHRRPALNADGMKLAWKFYNQGYSYAEISRAFRPIVSRAGIVSTLKKIARVKEG